MLFEDSWANLSYAKDKREDAKEQSIDTKAKTETYDIGNIKRFRIFDNWIIGYWAIPRSREIGENIIMV